MSQISFKRFKWFLNPRGTGEVELENSPDGWIDSNITFTRSAKYSGLLRVFTLPLKFVRKGAFIARMEFWMHMLTPNLPFRIDRLTDGVNNYKTILNGKLDIPKGEDAFTSFSVPAIPNDFSVNIDAYDSVQYAIPLDGDDAINLELTPIILSEIANLLPSGPPDGSIHSDYFPPIQVVNNQQNSLNASVQTIPYGQLRLPDFSTSANWFYYCRFGGKVLIKGSLGLILAGGISGTHNLRLSIVNQAGTIVYSFYDGTPASGFSTLTVSINAALTVAVGDKLFLYMQQVDAETINTGITIAGGELDLSYKTSSPASMCRALRGHDLFARVLQAMNVNNDSGPNLPVPNQSFLLDKLKQVVYTSADSIRAATGSIYREADGLYPGGYLVIAGTVNYDGGVFNVGDKFTYVNGQNNFTGSDGVAQKIKSIAINSVYNVGDPLQQGGTYLVEIGDDSLTGQFLTYNGIEYPVGGEFTFVLGQTSFTVSNDSMFVVQLTESPQIVVSLADLFQDVLSEVGGQAALGVEQQSNPDPVKRATQPTIGVVFLEDLGYVYRKGINNVSLGMVDETTKFVSAIDLLGNKIKAGYDDPQLDSINGAQEVNSTQNWTTTITNVSKEINLVSPFYASPYFFEGIRITQNDSAASRSDNVTCKIWIKSTPEPAIGGSGIFAGFKYWHPLRAEGYISLTGVDPSYYNYMLSPKQCLLRGGAYLSSIFYNMKGYQITLASALKNSNMVYIGLDGKRVAEGEPISISDLPAPLFCPYYATIIPGLSNNILDMLDSTPYADLNFDFNGVNTKAFINKFSVQIGNDKPTETKLLLTPDNDLTKYIR